MSDASLKAAYDKERWAEHGERLRADCRKYYAKNRERILARMKLYRAANRERISASNRAWAVANSESYNAYKKEWREANRDRRRDQHLTKQYGISLRDYEAMAVAQDHACQICKAVAKTERFGVLHVDHDHASGAIRGLLCANCNKALGGFQDDREILAAAILYLDGSR